MKILIVADTFSPDINGAARFAERLASGLKSKGYDIYIAAPCGENKNFANKSFYYLNQEKIQGNILNIYRIKSKKYKNLHYVPLNLAKKAAKEIISSIKPDIIHINSFLILGYYFGKYVSDIPLVATNHFMHANMSDYIPYYSAISKYLDYRAKKTYNKANIITAPTPYAAKLLGNIIKSDSVMPISCGINTGKYIPIQCTQERLNKKQIIYVGRLAKEKCVNILIQAAARLNAKLIIIGQGECEEELKTLAKSLDLKVEFKKNLTDSEIASSLNKSTLFCMPSIAELQSIASLEALSTGLPVCLADAGALYHLVDKENINGYLFKPNDIDDLTEKLSKILNCSLKEYKAMSSNALKLAKTHSFENTLSSFENIYKQALKDPCNK